MKVRVTFYGRLKELAGMRQQELELSSNPATLQTVVDCLLERHPGLREQLETVAYAVGAELVELDTPVEDGVEIGLLPPVSGG
jgi:molybdopterin synthase sulfur carrier subunit